MGREKFYQVREIKRLKFLCIKLYKAEGFVECRRPVSCLLLLGKNTSHTGKEKLLLETNPKPLSPRTQGCLTVGTCNQSHVPIQYLCDDDHYHTV